MRIREMTLREVQMKLITPFEISVGRTELRRILLVVATVIGFVVLVLAFRRH